MADLAAVAAEAGAGSAAPGVRLPPLPATGAMSLEEALAHRRSVRESYEVNVVKFSNTCSYKRRRRNTKARSQCPGLPRVDHGFSIFMN